MIHETAIIDQGATIGEATKIWHWTHICAGARIGNHCSLGQNVYVANDVVIGNNVKIQNNVSIYDAITIEDDAFCGPSMVFTNVINPRSHIERKHEYKRTTVRQGATIGANATIVCGVEIGRYAFVGAGSVVTKTLPAYALAIGIPAKVIDWVCRCGLRLHTSLKDGIYTCECSLSYEVKNQDCKLHEKSNSQSKANHPTEEHDRRT